MLFFLSAYPYATPQLAKGEKMHAKSPLRPMLKTII
jgi:hypothetical protein